MHRPLKRCSHARGRCEIKKSLFLEGSLNICLRLPALFLYFNGQKNLRSFYVTVEINISIIFLSLQQC